MRRAALIVVVPLLAVLATACSVSLDDHPRDIPDDAIRPLADESASDVGITGSSRIFLVERARQGEFAQLRSVVRDVPSSPSEALPVLFEGPTQDERDAGLTSEIPSGVELVKRPTTVDGVLTVNVTGGLRDLTGENATLAVAQIVATGWEIEGVEGVRIEIDGQRPAWPDGSGEQVSRALSIYDYTNLLASAQPDYPAVPSE